MILLKDCRQSYSILLISLMLHTIKKMQFFIKFLEILIFFLHLTLSAKL